MDAPDERFLRQAIQLAHEAHGQGERPFGAVLVYAGQVVGTMADGCCAANDPTAHAELRLISAYCRSSRRFRLDGHTLYASAEPCVMCAGAIKWAGLSRVVFSVSQGMLQQLSGGRPKPSCASLLNTGGRQIAVDGPCLVEAGLAALDGFDFAAHRQRLLDAQP